MKKEFRHRSFFCVVLNFAPRNLFSFPPAVIGSSRNFFFLLESPKIARYATRFPSVLLHVLQHDTGVNYECKSPARRRWCVIRGERTGRVTLSTPISIHAHQHKQITRKRKKKKVCRPVFVARENRKNSLCARFLLFLFFFLRGKKKKKAPRA